jgi:hypothetical protein
MLKFFNDCSHYSQMKSSEQLLVSEFINSFWQTNFLSFHYFDISSFRNSFKCFLLKNTKVMIVEPHTVSTPHSIRAMNSILAVVFLFVPFSTYLYEFTLFLYLYVIIGAHLNLFLHFSRFVSCFFW